jgi:hypothetical protein
MSTSSIIPPAVEQATTPLSPERLAEIRDREAAATPGPWGTYDDGTGRLDIAADLEETGTGYSCRRSIAQTDEYPIDNDPAHAEWASDQDLEQSQADAEFIAAARTDVPALLAEVNRLSLTPHERLILRFALEMADDAIASNPTDFTDEDTAAMAKLRALSTGPVVAYRNPWQPGVLLCLEHGEGWAGMKTLSVEDLPNGGTCTAGDPANPDDVCGRNVLAPEAGDPR